MVSKFNMLWIFYILLYILAIVGWIINLVSVVVTASASASVSTLFIVKVVGIFLFPLGSVLGIVGLFL